MYKNSNEPLQKAWEKFRDLLIQDKQKPLDVFVVVEDCYRDIKQFTINEVCYRQQIKIYEDQIVIVTTDKTTGEETAISLVGNEIDEYIKILVIAKVLAEQTVTEVVEDCEEENIND